MKQTNRPKAQPQRGGISSLKNAGSTMSQASAASPNLIGATSKLKLKPIAATAATPQVTASKRKSEMLTKAGVSSVQSLKPKTGTQGSGLARPSGTSGAEIKQPPKSQKASQIQIVPPR